ncbi:long-chain fatty acid--CoA ligase [Acidovorax sp. Be4]|uniref:Long-chain fatty acid--CoA ligase n=1 Tax=Acidovorax bellezanensis TaxID=2976702 RepID=A0ABT2PRL3_9BURK|nr:long-chain fatty acid--CoA ligase [Acidovorax sp. Be4]MCT9812930.1 long-chain fatty acid--CoA ligase [Acidovorax sp. Be4]
MSMTLALRRSIQTTPEQTATVFHGRRQSFCRFGDRVARLASALRTQGMGSGDRVGMLGVNSDRWLEVMMGVWWGGGVLNPVNTRWSGPEIVYSLDDSDTGILLVDDHFLHQVEGIRTTARRPPLLIHVGEQAVPEGMLSLEALMAASAPMDDAHRAGSDLACILYTGGTTGFPKGVMHSHGTLWAIGIQRLAQTPMPGGSVALHVAPLFHMGGMGRALVQFIAGETHVLLSSFDAREVMQTIERERVSDLLLVPTMLQALITHPEFDCFDLSSLRRMVYGTSPIAEAVLERALDLLPHVAFTHSYGLTELGSATTNPPHNHGAQGRASGLSRSAGRANAGLAVKVVNGDGVELPRGEVGELVVAGPNLMLGYWNKPQETAQALRGGWLYTGDGAHMDGDGYVFIVDRLKDMIVSGGENVYSAEVENVIARHPGVMSCAVIGVPHPQWGEAVHAVVVRKPGAALEAPDLHAHCKAFIAGYKCPKSIEFREALPLSAAGKVLKRELRAPHWAGQSRQVG